MKLLISAITLTLLSVSCASLKPGCLIQDKIASIASDVVVSKLQCSNAFAVKTDVENLVKNLGLCKTGPIAEMVCPLVAGEVADKLLSVSVPAEWGCSAMDAKATLKNAIVSACKLIPVKNFEN